MNARSCLNFYDRLVLTHILYKGSITFSLRLLKLFGFKCNLVTTDINSLGARYTDAVGLEFLQRTHTFKVSSDK